jgi:hypothetical protein
MVLIVDIVEFVPLTVVSRKKPTSPTVLGVSTTNDCKRGLI